MARKRRLMAEEHPAGRSKKAQRSFAGLQPTTAQDKTLNTTELLELILIGLDFKTLLVGAQRVCKAWRDLVQSSPNLQRKLFLRSATIEEARALNMLEPESLVEAGADGIHTFWNIHTFDHVRVDWHSGVSGITTVTFKPLPSDSLASWNEMSLGIDRLAMQATNVTDNQAVIEKLSRRPCGLNFKAYKTSNFSLDSRKSVRENLRELEGRMRTRKSRQIDWRFWEICLGAGFRSDNNMRYQHYLEKMASGWDERFRRARSKKGITGSMVDR